MILDDIIAQRRIQLEREKSEISESEMKKTAEVISSPCKGFGKALKASGLSVIAEVKKASPSKGVIQPDFHPGPTAESYEKAGAAAISCLTEEHYFMGSSRYLQDIRGQVDIPVLRKDFIFDPYQIYEAKVIGADAVLLIAAALSPNELKELLKVAGSLDLDVLTEAHNEIEVNAALEAGCTIIGINNRDLKTFNVTLDTTERLMKLIPTDMVRVSESGIKDSTDMKRVSDCGADAVLIGETLMRSGSIAESFKQLMDF